MEVMAFFEKKALLQPPTWKERQRSQQHPSMFLVCIDGVISSTIEQNYFLAEIFLIFEPIAYLNCEIGHGCKEVLHLHELP